MHELYEELEDMCMTLSDELAKTNDKLSKSSGNISASDIDYINKLTHAIKSVETTKAMLGSDYSNSYDRSYENGDMGGSHRGRGRYAKRDSMGRYSSERGYSRDSMIDELEDLKSKAPDERTRQEFQRMINKMQSM